MVNDSRDILSHQSPKETERNPSKTDFSDEDEVIEDTFVHDSRRLSLEYK